MAESLVGKSDRSDHVSFLEHRHAQQTPRACGFDQGNNRRRAIDICFILRQIRNVLHGLSPDDARKRNIRKAVQINYRLARPPLHIGWRCIVERGYTKAISLAKIEISKLSLT